MTRPIVVVGSINQDLVVRSARTPAAGETVFGDSFQTSHGGKGANQAVAIARLGHPVGMIGCVGQDSFGHELHDALTNAGVNTTAIRTVPGSSGIAVIHVENDGTNRITVVPGANAALTPALLASHDAALANAALVLAQLEIPMETVEALATLCEQAHVPLMLDPAPARLLSTTLLRRVAWLTPNATEALTLLGQAAAPPPRTPRDALDLARQLRALGPEFILLKLGDLGAVVVAGDAEPVFQPAFPVEALDTTAAGDACNAGFALALAQNQPLAEALRFSTAAAAICVTRHGAQQAMPTMGEVQAFLSEHRETIQPA